MGGLVEYRFEDGTTLELPPEFVDYPGGPVAKVRAIMNKRYAADIDNLCRKLRRIHRRVHDDEVGVETACRDIGGIWQHNPVLQALIRDPVLDERVLVYEAALFIRGEKLREEEIQEDLARQPAARRLRHQSLPGWGVPEDGPMAILDGLSASERDRPLALDWEPQLGRNRELPEPAEPNDLLEEVDVEDEVEVKDRPVSEQAAKAADLVGEKRWVLYGPFAGEQVTVIGLAGDIPDEVTVASSDDIEVQAPLAALSEKAPDELEDDFFEKLTEKPVETIPLPDKPSSLTQTEALEYARQGYDPLGAHWAFRGLTDSQRKELARRVR